MTIFHLKLDQQELFAQHLEVFHGVQLGLVYHRDRGQYCIVISGMIALVFDSRLDGEIYDFMDYTWRLQRDTAFQQSTILDRYHAWMRRWDPPDHVVPVNTTRADILNIAINGVPPIQPPPPPNRPTIIPGAPGGRGTLPSTVAHLPFSTISEDREVFYRWEAFPSSLRVLQATNTVVPWTFASPSAEVPFNPTGFAAVARAALPSFFPAVFRWEIQPRAGTPLLCGAVVPMYGQSGGGVEVCFYAGATNVGPIANQVVIQPL